MIAGTAGNRIEHRDMPAGWRGNGGLWDVGSHIGNVPGSMALVCAGALLVAGARHHLLTEVPLKKAFGTAAAALAVGCGANAAFETPAILNTPVMQEHFSTLAADPFDEIYGDATSAATAALLLQTMRSRRRDAATPPGATEIPTPPGSDDV
jgi:hypothetical protein